MGGGSLYLLGSHVIDLLSYLGLGRVVRVNATLRTLNPVTTSIGIMIFYELIVAYFWVDSGRMY